MHIITKDELYALRIMSKTGNFKGSQYVMIFNLYCSLQEKQYIILHPSGPIEITDLGRKILECTNHL